MPSQAKIRKEISLSSYFFLISGMAVIIYSPSGIVASDLYSKSPRDLERFKTPLTLLSSTNPPAYSILFFSPGKSGL